MAVRFETSDGRQGTLDVANLAKEELNGEIIGVNNGIVMVHSEDGKPHAFSLAQWAQDNQCTITLIQGYNSPETALNEPPQGMNHLDQSAFYNDGADTQVLSEMYPDNRELEDGRIVVLDHDGLWRTMWSSDVHTPMPSLTFDEEVDANMVNDPRLTIRVAGIEMLFGLTNVSGKTDKENNYKISDVVKALTSIQKNCPHENRTEIGKMLSQTTGLDPWKFNNAVIDPESTGEMLKNALKMTGFEFRSYQLDYTDKMVRGLRIIALEEFAKHTKPLLKMPEADRLLINLGGVLNEFVQVMVQMDILRDISRTTGLADWQTVNEGVALDETKMPEMPEFVQAFVKLMRWALPIVKNPKLQMAQGKNGLKGIIALLLMIDECIFTLAEVPEHSAKAKMFFSLKRLQTTLETKLAFLFQPDPNKNTKNLLENPFMVAKALYTPKRETLYALCQNPKESWNNTLLTSLREAPNIEQFYDELPAGFAKIVKRFAAMDAAFDIQPWVDVNHAERTHDPFSQYNESFGAMPPEAGYLAKNSPRAIFNISETLVQGAAYIANLGDTETKSILRNPFLLRQLMKAIMTASINREVGTVEVLSKMGVGPDMDIMGSPDASRIWEDPEIVQRDNEYQLQEMMGQMAMQQAMQAEQQGAKEKEAIAMREQAGDEGEDVPELGGGGPMGPPTRATGRRSA
jgi:hypothetical protein